MVSSNPFFPTATYDSPPLAGPGAIRLRLDTGRHLQSLTAMPLDRNTVNEHTAPFDWTGLFDAAGLDPKQFELAVPLWTPPAAFDARSAWLERGAADPRRVEAAAWRGRPVFFGSRRNSESAKAPAGPSAAFAVYGVALLTLISVLAWHNLRRGRGDLRGAARFGLFIAAAAFARNALMAPHPAGTVGFHIFVAITGNMLWAGATSAIGYLALEPFVRRRWPHALITWTRVLNGRFRDPVVAQHLLAGLLCGAAVMLAVKLLTLLEFGVELGWTFLMFPGASRATQGVLSMLIGAASETPWLFCLLFVAVTVFRNKWFGACAAGAILSAPYLWGANSPVLGLVVVPILGVGLMLFALRYGLFALVVAMFVVDLRDFPLTLDTSAFYFSMSLVALVTILGLGAYAYRNAVAGQRLWS